MRVRRAVVAVALVCLVASCTSDSSDDESPGGSRSSEQGTGETGNDSGEDDGSGDEPEAAAKPPESATSGDTWSDAERVESRQNPLDWTSRALSDSGPAAATKDWTGVADSLGKRVVLSGPDNTLRFRTRSGRVQGLEMQWPWAVVYAGGGQPGAGASGQPGQLVVFDLRNGKRREVGSAGSAPPAAASGTVSLHDGELAYATGPNNRYCLAKLSLDSLDGQRVGCAKPLKEGFTQFRLTSEGFGFTSFDDRRPNSCMTLKTIRGDDSNVVNAAKKCAGWEVVPGGDATVWLQVKNPNRVERAQAYAQTSDGAVHALGPAMSGTTTWCDGATYFVRPASKDGRADDLMRWSPDAGLEVVWTPRGRSMSYVFAPHCGGSTVTLPGFDGNQNPVILSAST